MFLASNGEWEILQRALQFLGKVQSHACIHQTFYPQSRVKSNPEHCLLGPVLVGMAGLLEHLPWWLPWTCANDQWQGPASSPGMAFSDTHSLEMHQLDTQAALKWWMDEGRRWSEDMLQASRKRGWCPGPLKEQPQPKGWRPQRASKRGKSHLTGRGVECQ